MGTSSTTNDFDLPDEVLQALPSDPFAQLDVARKITSIALTTRVSALESEASVLRSQLTDKDDIISDLQSQIESLDASLSETIDRVSRAEKEKENLLKENSSLSNTVAKLRRDVSKLEVFRKTLMQSLQEEDGGSAGMQEKAAKEAPTSTTISAQSQSGDDDPVPPPAYSSTDTETLEHGNSSLEDREAEVSRPRISPGLLLASQTSTPRLTPPGSPPISASVSPSRTSKPASPRRHSVSFSTTRGMLDSLPSSTHSSFSGSESTSGRPRVDGKEFFRQVRSRLSYEQFGAFLANVKELNSHKQTKEETLRKADEIFGPDNKDLYTIFEGLLTRNMH
ncbi:uncharacterized protein At4g15545-like [Chenopodium quinoa]|uniref:uncharacterized protein At4g15545-like n=1 Tax=Chenopodium quinoa TaxID=63459 RepID=UPI000B78E026|nr:uncharacterized protein At4g15545-like [Chenopodium quinoa]